MSGIGPGTGVAEAGAMVCCADAADMPVAARIAPTHTLRMGTLVMTFPPCLWQDPTGVCLNCCVATVPSRFFERCATASTRNNADAAGEWFGHRELAVYELKRKRGQGAGGGTVHHRRALARIVVRIMTRAFQNLLLSHPPIHLATGVRTDRGIGNDAVGRAILG